MFKSSDPPEQPSASVYRFEIQDGLLLFDGSSNTLFAYNGVARFIWELIEARRTEPEIVAAVAAQWAIAASSARDDVRAIVALWRAQGLLAFDREAPARLPPIASVATIMAPSAPPSEWTCTIRGTTIAFTVVAELPTAIRALLSHLETPGAAAETRMAIAKAPSGEFAFAQDGVERLRTGDPALAAGAMFVAVLECIRPGSEWFALIHGAALARHGQGLALIGASGSGKSTLAASLMRAGFDYLADDLVALSAPDAAIVPWPLPLSLKPGSIGPLLPQYPDLAQVTTRYPTKGVEARLLLPRADVWDADPVRLRMLIFPRFTEGAAPEARRLSSFDALQRLLADRVWLGDPLTEERVRGFLAWLDETPAYAISFGTLADAVGLVEGIVP